MSTTTKRARVSTKGSVGHVGVEHDFPEWMSTGSRVHNFGDTANTPTDGTVTQMRSTDWGKDVEVTTDEGNAYWVSVNCFYASPLLEQPRIVQIHSVEVRPDAWKKLEELSAVLKMDPERVIRAAIFQMHAQQMG